MTKSMFRWKIFSAIAICFFLTSTSRANSDLDSSLRLPALPMSNPSFSKFHPGKMDCSLAGTLIDSQPVKTWSAKSSVQPAPTANAKPVDVAVNQFSAHKFGQIGFTPQCLFVDHSVPRGYLETKIAGTLEAGKNYIYDTDDIRVANDKKSVDRYWQYYSDCDSWDVVFKRLPEPSKNQQVNPLHQILTLANDFPSQFRDTWVRFNRHLEFVAVEMEGVDTAPRFSEVIIKKLRNVRPVVEPLFDRELVAHWWQMQQCWILSEWYASPVADVWNQIPSIHLYDPIEVEFQPKPFDTRWRWIAQEIKELLTR